MNELSAEIFSTSITFCFRFGFIHYTRFSPFLSTACPRKFRFAYYIKCTLRLGRTTYFLRDSSLREIRQKPPKAYTLVGLPSLAERHLGCPAGLEPAISGVTILRLDQLDYGQHLEARTGIEPVFAVLQTVAYSSIDNRAILKSYHDPHAERIKPLVDLEEVILSARNECGEYRVLWNRWGKRIPRRQQQPIRLAPLQL